MGISYNSAMQTVTNVLKTTAKEYLNLKSNLETTETVQTGKPVMKIKAKATENESKAAADVKRFNTSLHARLVSLTEEPAGFAASEVTGYSAAQVRKAAEAMAEANLLVRWKVSPRRVRYFATEEQARAFKPAPVTGRVAGPNGGTRMKAGWSTDEPGIITPQTKITIAPRLPRNVYRSNTYLKF